MNKLTKHQRQYRKRRKDSEKDFRAVPRHGKEPGVRVTRKPLKVNVSQEAFDRLAQLADEAQITRWEMLTRMIIQGIPGYASCSTSMSRTERYHWPSHLLEPQERTVKYKGETGTKQINYSITSTAWKKLECHKTAIGQSKARIIQFLILRYKPLTEAQLAKAKDAAKKGLLKNNLRARLSAAVELGVIAAGNRAHTVTSDSLGSSREMFSGASQSIPTRIQVQNQP